MIDYSIYYSLFADRMEEVAVTVLILQSKIHRATTHVSVQPTVRE